MIVLGSADHLLLWNLFNDSSSEGKLSFNSLSKAGVPARLILMPATPPHIIRGTGG